MNKLWILAALLGVCLCACQNQKNRSPKPGKKNSARAVSGRPHVNTTMGDSRADAERACARGDFRLWSLRDTADDVWVTPSYHGAGGRLQAQNLGYAYETRLLVDNQGAASAEEIRGYYKYAVEYNDAVFAYMRAHSRNSAAPAEKGPAEPPAPYYEDAPAVSAPIETAPVKLYPLAPAASTVNRSGVYAR